MCWSINLSVRSCSVSRLPLSSWHLGQSLGIWTCTLTNAMPLWMKPSFICLFVFGGFGHACPEPVLEWSCREVATSYADNPGRLPICQYNQIYRTSCFVLILHAPTATKVTFNFGITSHDNFEGNDLTFCGMFDAADHRKYHHTNLVGTKSAYLHSIMLQCLPVAHVLPRFTSIIMHYHCSMVGVGGTYLIAFCLADCWFYLRYKHAKGRCVVHSGKRRHGAMDIEKVAELEFTDVTTCPVIWDFDGRSILVNWKDVPA